jgi:hypothetical protein
MTSDYNLTAVFVQTQYLFSDGFESGSFGNWTGTARSSGETSAVTSENPYEGTYSARFTSNGGGGYETAYCYDATSAAELYARGYFFVSQSGIADNSDYISLIVFRAGSTNVAWASWSMNNGVIKWKLLIRSGTGYASAYSASIPTTNTWYAVELHLKVDSTQGLGELWVDGTLVCSITGRNTASYGNVSMVRFGLGEIYNCAGTVVYSDNTVISAARVGPISSSLIAVQSLTDLDSSPATPSSNLIAATPEYKEPEISDLMA